MAPPVAKFVKKHHHIDYASLTISYPHTRESHLSHSEGILSQIGVANYSK